MQVSLALRIFLPFALGYLLSSIFRSIGSLIANDLALDLGLNAGELGFAVSAFFLAAIFVQIPYGIMLDRYDPRKVYAVSLLLCAAGAIMVALTPNMLFLALGRAFIAIGTSASAVTSFKIYSMWFPPERLPLANGLSIAAGGLGLMTGTAPAAAAMQFIDWREIHLIIAGFLVIGATIVVTIAPSKPTKSVGLTLGQQIKGLSVILKSSAFWRVAPFVAVLIGTFGGYPSLWTGPWVRDVANFSDSQTAILMLVLTAAMTASGLATGFLADLAKRIGLTPLDFCAFVGWIFVAILALIYLQWIPSDTAVFIIWFSFGFIAPLGMVMYPAMGALFPPEYTGRLNACLTLSWFLGSFMVQNIYGFMLNQFPTSDGSYALGGHRLGTGIMVLLMIGALIWFHLSVVFEKRQPAT